MCVRAGAGAGAAVKQTETDRQTTPDAGRRTPEEGETHEIVLTCTELQKHIHEGAEVNKPRRRSAMNQENSEREKTCRAASLPPHLSGVSAVLRFCFLFFLFFFFVFFRFFSKGHNSVPIIDNSKTWVFGFWFVWVNNNKKKKKKWVCVGGCVCSCECVSELLLCG